VKNFVRSLKSIHNIHDSNICASIHRNKIARRRSRGNSRSSYGSTDDLSSSSDDDCVHEVLNKSDACLADSAKATKLTKEEQWNANVDYLLKLINDKLMNSSELSTQAVDNLEVFKEAESKDRVTAMELTWMEPVVNVRRTALMLTYFVS